MAIANDKTLLRIGRGKLFVKRIDDGNPISGEGFVYGHQVTSLTYTPNEEKLEEPDASSAIGSVLASLTVARKPTIKATFKSFDFRLLALGLMGSTINYDQDATEQVESNENVLQGSYLSLGKLGPVTGVSVAVSGKSPVENTDYVVEDATGLYPMIYIVPGSTQIATGATAEVTYTPTSYDLVEQVAGATKSEITCALRFVSTESYGPQFMFDAWKASVNIESVLEFIQQTTEFGSYDVTFTLLDDTANHPTTPFIDLRRMDNAA